MLRQNKLQIRVATLIAKRTARLWMTWPHGSQLRLYEKDLVIFLCTTYFSGEGQTESTHAHRNIAHHITRKIYKTQA